MSRKPKINPNPYKLNFYWDTHDQTKEEATKLINNTLALVCDEKREAALQLIKDIWEMAYHEGWEEGDTCGFECGYNSARSFED